MKTRRRVLLLLLAGLVGVGAGMGCGSADEPGPQVVPDRPGATKSDPAVRAARRLYDGGSQYAHAQDVLHWNTFMSVSAWLLMVAQIPFIINLFLSIKKGVKVGSNPWQATTLEWSAAPSPPVAHGNFPQIPVVTRGPYEYSPPGTDKTFLPQDAAAQEG